MTDEYYPLTIQGKSDNAFQLPLKHHCQKISLKAFILWIAGMALSDHCHVECCVHIQ